jgi:uncharacterized protein (UPF0297 family)
MEDPTIGILTQIIMHLEDKGYEIINELVFSITKKSLLKSEIENSTNGT